MRLAKYSKGILLIILLIQLACQCDARTFSDPSDSLAASQYFSKAASFQQSTDYDSAIVYFEKASAIFENTDDWRNHIECLDQISDSYRQLGRYDEGLKVGNIALKLVHEKLGRDNLLESEVLNTVGIIHDYKGNFDQALLFQKESIRIKTELLGEGHFDLASPYHNLGVVYYYFGDYEKALDCYDKVLSIYQHTQLSTKITSTYNNIGQINVLKGDYALGLEYLNKAVTMALENKGENDLGVASIYNSIGVLYYFKKEYNTALYYHEKVLKIKEAHLDSDHPYMVVTYNNLGLVHGHTGNYKNALEFFNKSLAIQRKTLGDVHVDIASTYRFIGEIYAKSGDYNQAINYYGKALQLRTQIFGTKHPDIAESYNDLAKTYQKKGDSEKVLALSQHALVANLPNFQDSVGYSNPTLANYFKQNFLLTSLQLKAEAFQQIFGKSRNQNDLIESLNTFKLCDQLIDQISQDRLQHADKITFGKTSVLVYEKAVTACVARYQESQDDNYLQLAYYFSEKSKASVLRQTLSDNSAKSFGLVPSELLALEKQLKIDRAYFQSKVRSNRATGGEDDLSNKDLESKAFITNRTLDSLILSFEENFPEYYQLKYQNKITGITELQKFIKDPNSAIIEYFITDSLLYAFTITQGSYSISSTPIGIDLDSLVQALRVVVAGKNQKHSDFVRTSYEMYQLLISPIAPYLSDQVDKVIIVPHGALSLIPFELLLTKAPNNRGEDYRQLPYLLNDYQVVYANSGTLWAKEYDRKTDWDYQFAGYAPTYQTAQLAESRALETYGGFRDKLSNLKYTGQEITNASSYFGGVTYTGKTATESIFKKEGSKYQILHLAMHALVDEENPLNSKLIFTQEGDTLEDGFLNAYELYNMELNAELAVLSACNTGYGKLAKGEGVMSLGRAFSYAGCPSIVMSLWPAQDQATSDIMTYFYEGLSKGHSKDQALREAKLKYLENADDLFAHPFYWAGFVVQGDPKPLQLNQTTSLRWVYLILSLLGFSILSIIIFQKKKKQLN